jgi:hypothetical protein
VVRPQDRFHVFGVELLGAGSEADQVGEQNRQTLRSRRPSMVS